MIPEDPRQQLAALVGGPGCMTAGRGRRSPGRPDRRGFLGSMSAAALAALTARPARVWGALPLGGPPATADCCIVLWMAGGMAHTETFDPKRYTPYAPDVPTAGLMSTFPSVPTAVDGLRFSAGLERIGGVMDRGALIRSYTAGDLGFILHSRHQYHWHTGYVPPQTVACPHLGAVIARTLGPRDPAVPAFIHIGQRFDLGEGEELKAFTTAGFLGAEYGPLNLPLPQQASGVVRPGPGMSASRVARREKLWRDLVAASPVARESVGAQQESLVRSIESAHRLLHSPAARALDLATEPEASVRRYLPPGVAPGQLVSGIPARDGSYEAATAGRFGLGCLLARRLVEAGARFIEVTTEYIPFVNWDTHEFGHERVVHLKRQIDGAVAQLVLDLEERGLLGRTLIVLASEFSRDTLIEGRPGRTLPDQAVVPDRLGEPAQYGLHRHFTDAGSVLLFGGGVRRGHVHGETAPERPCRWVRDRVVIEDLHATIYQAMGIPPTLAHEVEGRPFYVTRDGQGRPIQGLLGRGA